MAMIGKFEAVARRSALAANLVTGIVVEIHLSVDQPVRYACDVTRYTYEVDRDALHLYHFGSEDLSYWWSIFNSLEALRKERAASAVEKAA